MYDYDRKQFAPKPDEDWLYVDEIAAELRVSVQTVRKWIRDGKLIGGKFGRPRNSISLRGPTPYRVLRRDLNKFIRGEFPDPNTHDITLASVEQAFADADRIHARRLADLESQS